MPLTLRVRLRDGMGSVDHRSHRCTGISVVMVRVIVVSVFVWSRSVNTHTITLLG